MNTQEIYKQETGKDSKTECCMAHVKIYSEEYVQWLEKQTQKYDCISNIMISYLPKFKKLMEWADFYPSAIELVACKIDGEDYEQVFNDIIKACEAYES